MLPDALPVGSIIPYAGPINNPNNPNGGSNYPDYGSKAYNLYLQQHGWLVCDGSTVLVAKYPELFRFIGFIYGQAGPGKFMLPDYRGRFLRGVNLDASGPDNLPRDPQEGQRTASSSGGWSGNQVGSVQEDAFQAHDHLYEKATSQTALGYAGKGAFDSYTIPEAQTDGAVVPTGYTPTISIRQAPETRVKNAYVNFIIKCSRRPRPFGSLLEGMLDQLDNVGF
ncbi:phage tail protein [Sulfuriflexus mobilis]|uniref:phage tail protein n=1 Tax=Sulfuriflexus mobilis TaxID=1811807 RepID=UPI000F831826|nr:phage tail protein [Sulfuriflexus mobilis]